ncbi:hypothetical protein VNO77_04219 [Canavalia gladiata]|uniref:Uncharacterized protein n=1 Tax=Canavalia gladiata TaxID=3824 RepID=A0AAN9RCZ4_CANGL
MISRLTFTPQCSMEIETHFSVPDRTNSLTWCPLDVTTPTRILEGLATSRQSSRAIREDLRELSLFFFKGTSLPSTKDLRVVRDLVL